MELLRGFECIRLLDSTSIAAAERGVVELWW